jgi:microcystin-dependent protein
MSTTCKTPALPDAPSLAPITTTMSQNLSITQTGAVARITLTQPEIRNAFSDEVIAELTAAFVDVGSRADVRWPPKALPSARAPT